METKEKYVKIRRLNPDKPIVVYSGSMIQQNHGEKPFGHGYVLWDVKKREALHPCHFCFDCISKYVVQLLLFYYI